MPAIWESEVRHSICKSEARHWPGLSQLKMLAVLVLTACGGGGGSKSTPATTQTPPPGLAANQISITVEQNTDPGITISTFNQPYATITLCNAVGACQSITHVLVDTGSYGLRLPAAAVTVALPVQTDGNGNPLAECTSFLSGYMWGSVRTATLKLGGEVASNIPVQITDDPNFSALLPSTCAGTGTDLGNEASLGANGILGIGLFINDDQFYYSCSSTSCSNYPLVSSQQVSNPVANFLTDNNGVIISLPNISNAGAVSAVGALTFGINTQANNTINGFAFLAAVSSGINSSNISAVVGSETSTLTTFLDSGSNFTSFKASIPTNGSYYTPPSLETLNVSLGVPVAYTGTIGVIDLSTLSSAYNAFNDIASQDTSGSIDLGLPFFFGKSVAFLINGDKVAQGAGPAYAVR